MPSDEREIPPLAGGVGSLNASAARNSSTPCKHGARGLRRWQQWNCQWRPSAAQTLPGRRRGASWQDARVASLQLQAVRQDVPCLERHGAVWIASQAARLALGCARWIGRSRCGSRRSAAGRRCDDSVALAGQPGAVAGPVHTAGAGAAGRRRGAAERRRASVSWLRPAAGNPPTRGGERVGGSCHIQTVNPRHQLWNAFLQPLWGGGSNEVLGQLPALVSASPIGARGTPS